MNNKQRKKARMRRLLKKTDKGAFKFSIVTEELGSPYGTHVIFHKTYKRKNDKVVVIEGNLKREYFYKNFWYWL